ncbi:MAG: hypothetical protein K2L88_02975, partial [Clostridiales bacterium]|nr:hypothetical protein [Clostridiales bacterium]
MVSLKDKITAVNTVYYYSLDIDELQTALNDLEEVLSSPVLSAQNKDLGEALRMRVLCKIYALAYFVRFRDSIIDKMDECIAENMPVANDRGYNKSARVMTETQNLLKLVKHFCDTKDELSALSKSDKILTSESGFLSVVDTLVKEVECLPLESPFGEEVEFIDVKARLCEYFGDFKSEVYSAYGAALEHSVGCKNLDYNKYDYFPVPDYEEGGRAKAVILCTPFADEARLYAANAIEKDELLTEFDANEFAVSDDCISRVFAYIDYKKCAALITHAEMIGEDNLKSLLRRVMCAGKRGANIFVIDTEGGRLYDTAMIVAANDENLSALDISRAYITMPSFADVVDELKTIKLAQSDIECREKLKEMPFLGFMGLNEIIRPEYQSSWAAHGKKISAGHTAVAKRYLAKIKASMLFIDDGWGDFSSGTATVTDSVGEFDYDDIGNLDLANIRRIVESEATIFGKCGMIARYCTTGVGDMVGWDKLSRDELLERVTLATRLVFRVLRVPIVPIVEVLD